MKNLKRILLLSFLVTASAQASLEQVSTDVQVLILAQKINNEFILSEKDLCRCAQVSKAWDRITSSNRVWKIRAEVYYGLPPHLSEHSPLLNIRNDANNVGPNISLIRKIFLRLRNPQPEIALYASYKSVVQHRSAINQRFALNTKISMEDRIFKLTQKDMEKIVVSELFGDSSLVKFYLQAWKAFCIGKENSHPQHHENFRDLHYEVKVLINLGSKVAEAEKLKWQKMELYGYNNNNQE